MSGPTIQFFMSLRNTVKLYHWQTKSYARHVASDAFVSKIDSLIDKFVEVYIGRYERDPKISKKKDMEITVPVLSDSSIVTYLQDTCTWLEDQLPKGLNKKDTELISIRDEMLVEINQAIYLFTFQ
jgi:hypothetical protein